jgi:hypothetical protein
MFIVLMADDQGLGFFPASCHRALVSETTTFTKTPLRLSLAGMRGRFPLDLRQYSPDTHIVSLL